MCLQISSSLATFWDRAVHSVIHTLSLQSIYDHLFCNLDISRDMPHLLCSPLSRIILYLSLVKILKSKRLGPNLKLLFLVGLGRSVLSVASSLLIKYLVVLLDTPGIGSPCITTHCICLISPFYSSWYLNLVMRKPVFGVPDHV